MTRKVVVCTHECVIVERNVLRSLEIRIGICLSFGSNNYDSYVSQELNDWLQRERESRHFKIRHPSRVECWSEENWRRSVASDVIWSRSNRYQTLRIWAMFRFCANTLTRVTANRSNHDQILRLSKLFGSVKSSRNANLCLFVSSFHSSLSRI